MEYGIIGEHLKHSFSKEIHGLLADYEYTLREIPRQELQEFMEKRDFKAINVTIPYKESVLPYLDEISPIAKRIGAVNTIVNRNGSLFGDNTDYFGLKSLVLKNLDPKGKKVLILGSGGTSKTAVAVMTDLGAEKVARVSRSGRDGALTYEQAAQQCSDAQVLVNTTPCGMYPHCEEKPIDIRLFPKLEAVIDAIYNPLRSELVLDGLEAGISAEGGLYMLVAQAVRAVEVFLGTTLPAGTLEQVFAKLKGEKENIVLTGMPGCGKTTVGSILSSKLHREIVDTDAEIVKRIGQEISAFFAELGEEAFRREEQTVIAHVSSQTGKIISTGGGAVLRDANVRRLRSNGKIVFIDRALESLMPTADRPLALNRTALEARYRERYGRYCSTADVQVRADCPPEEVAQRILKALGVAEASGKDLL